MNSPVLLNSNDLCARRGSHARRWEPPAIHPTEALYESIEAGLRDDSESDPGEVASEHLMELATGRGLDSSQEDLLGQAEHLSGIANFVTWLLRTGSAWRRPESIKLPNGATWMPGSFLSADDGHLRRVVLCSRWDAYRQVQEEHDWRTLESSIYGVPMDLIVVVLGQERNGRRGGSLCKGWTHPVSKSLRFRKRDGTRFDGAWNPIYREQSEFTREEWLDALVEDGILGESIIVHRLPIPDRASEIVRLAESKIAHLLDEPLPEPQLSRCFDRFALCPYRSCCPAGLDPSESLGFVKVPSA